MDSLNKVNVIKITEEQESIFKEMHFKKIDMADEIFVIDFNGYVGSSTSKEIEYAKKTNKSVRYYSKGNDIKKQSVTP